jgi:hypothetical protein
MKHLIHRWELTPRELFEGFNFIKTAPAKDLPSEVLPFKCERQLLEGTPYEFQLAVSDRSVSQEVQFAYEADSSLPLSGDRRAGVLVFAGQEIIGGLIIPGNLAHNGYKITVKPGHRQEGLAVRMITEWIWATKRSPTIPKQGITLYAAKALLAAHKVCVARAVERNLPVPQRVLDAIAYGEETAQVLQEAQAVEDYVLPPKPASRNLLKMLLADRRDDHGR